MSMESPSDNNNQSAFSHTLRTIDLHACGEPARVVVAGMPDIEGDSMAEKRRCLMEKYDCIRKILLQEPRGYPCQNADIIFPSKMPGVQYGYVILEQNCIYPMMSGHNTICVATALLVSGMISIPEHDDTIAFDLEAPAGIISIKALIQNKKVKSITLKNVPSFRALTDCVVAVPQLGDVVVDVVYSGMWYCIVDATKLPKSATADDGALVLPLLPSNGKNICRLGEMIKVACREQFPVDHPQIDYPGCDILVFCSPGVEEVVTKGSHAKNAVVMSNGVLDWQRPDSWTGMLDRSPCGTGTSAVMVNLHLNGKLPLNSDFVHESIIGTQFTGRLVDKTHVGEFDAFIPEITGSAWVTQMCEVFVDPDDPFLEGYTVSDIWS